MKNIISSSSDLFSSQASFSLSSIISCASDFSILKFSLIKSTNLRRKHFFSSSILKVTHVTISNTPFGNGDSSHLPYTLYLCLYFFHLSPKKRYMSNHEWCQIFSRLPRESNGKGIKP